MSDPDDIPGRTQPRRAEPIRPDAPAGGDPTADTAGASAVPGANARRGADERPDAGLKNVREGYGGKLTDDHTDDPSMVPNRPASDAQ